MGRTKRLTVLAMSLAIMTGSFAVAQANELPEHGHLMLSGLVFDDAGDPIGYKKCRLLANGKALALHTHHDKLHFGATGDKLWDNASIAIVPLAPFPNVPWSNCEEFAEIVFGD